jgi:Zn-dependent membrane protease YugP
MPQSGYVLYREEDEMVIFWLLILISFAFSLWAQFKVRGNFSTWSRVPTYSGMTGAEVARRILDENGLYHVRVEPVPGMLSDHYDPTAPAVRLSSHVYYSDSVAAVAVAAHECGHALQHKEAYGALVFRHRMVPVLNYTSGFSSFLIPLGIIFHAPGLLLTGILFFSFVVLFHLVTLPVEYNASARAKRILARVGIIRGPEEERGVRRVLNAAAYTYVASAAVAVLYLLQYLSIFFLQNDDRN